MDQNTELIQLRVKSETNVGNLAAAIKGFRNSNPQKKIIVRYIGAGAAQQAIKAVVIANRMLLDVRNEYCLISPQFGDTEDNSTIMLLELKFFPLNSTEK